MQGAKKRQGYQTVEHLGGACGWAIKHYGFERLRLERRRGSGFEFGGDWRAGRGAITNDAGRLAGSRQIYQPAQTDSAEPLVPALD